MDSYRKLTAVLISSMLPGADANKIQEMLQYPSDSDMGDLSLPCFRLSKLLHKSPETIAGELKASLENGLREKGVISRLDSVSGYLNIFLERGNFSRELMSRILREESGYGAQNTGDGRTIVIDYSSPNIAKPFHVGHLRSTVIGNALYRIYSCLGYRCIRINYLGDWGTQFGKLITAYKLWGDEERLGSGAIDELLRLYVEFHAQAEHDPLLEDEARDWFVRMERGDLEALGLWRRFVTLSMAEFQKLYDLLGVRFDFVTGESFYNDQIEPVIKELKHKKLLEEDEGAWLVRLDDFNLPPALMLKRDGGSLYHTRDVAAALYRKDAYRFDKAIYVTDYSQSLHFQQWFKVVEMMGYEWAGDLVHVPFGRVSLEGASLSTRKGNVVKLEQVLDQAVRKTRAIIEEKNPQLENKDEVARQVGVGAVVFHDLSGNRMKDIVFSWEEVLSFEGETGPYVQYTYARACSVLRKGCGPHWAKWEPAGLLKYDLLAHDSGFSVLKQLSLFPERIERAADKMEPSIICRYLIDLAQEFNRFYHECPILVDDNDVSMTRLALVKCVRITLNNGLKLIGLEAPERM